jgi:hypothetical protein
MTQARHEHHFLLWAYLFMPEHAHLLIWPTNPDFSVSKVLKAVILAMIEYIHNNPVCSAATNLPDDEPWATPLAWARKLGLGDIEGILLKHGATG